MNLKEIREEVIAEGAENIATQTGGADRIDRWINVAVREICDFKPWPFLMATAEGLAPLTIADLGHVVAVLDVNGRRSLDPITFNQLLLGDPTQSAKGKAEYWYTEDGVTIQVAPADDSSILRVHYRKVAPSLVKDEDVPIIPAPYHNLIVERARVNVNKATDNFEAAGMLMRDYKEGRDGMVHALMKFNYDKERFITRSGRPGDYVR